MKRLNYLTPPTTDSLSSIRLFGRIRQILKNRIIITMFAIKFSLIITGNTVRAQVISKIILSHMKTHN